jgi:hypothetical protein
VLVRYWKNHPCLLPYGWIEYDDRIKSSYPLLARHSVLTSSKQSFIDSYHWHCTGLTDLHIIVAGVWLGALQLCVVT